jgi:drug/metabolite transporter (DMT)-like permease
MSSAAPFLAAAVLLAAAGNLLLRRGMRDRGAPRSSSAGASLAATARHALASPSVWSGTLAYAAAMACWLIVLGRAEIGLVYPAFAGGTTLCVMAASVLVLGERLEPRRAIGAALVVAGIALASLG